MVKISCFDGEVYKGYKISLKLVREGLGEYEPYSIQSPMDVYRFMRDLEDSDRERYFTIFLDVKNNVIGCEEAFVGSLDRAVVHPREVFKSALTCSAASIIAVHNHPSGDPRPSPEDKSMTQKLYVCGDLLGIKVMDSIIIGHRSFYSFRESRVRKVEDSEGEEEHTGSRQKSAWMTSQGITFQPCPCTP